MKLEKKPRITFTPLAWRKMFSYARAVDTEITGFGEVEVRGNEMHVIDTYIFPQKANMGYVKLDSGALLDWMDDCKRKGQQQRVQRSNLWWHSHVNGRCFRSGTDDDTVERLLTTMPYVIACTVNKHHQYELSLHLKDPYRITFNNMNPFVNGHDLGRIDRDCDAEARKMVVDSTPKRDIPAIQPYSGKTYDLSSKAPNKYDLWERYRIPTKYKPPVIEDPEALSNAERDALEEYLYGVDKGTKSSLWDDLQSAQEADRLIREAAKKGGHGGL